MSGNAFALDRRAMLAAGAGSLLIGGASPPAQAKERALPGTGRDQPFDDGWLFRRGEGAGLEAIATDEAGWRRIDLPHDWSIEDAPGGALDTRRGPFDKAAVGGTAVGFTVGGEGWYRKHFRLPGLAGDARVEIEFDGVANECDVWLNGTHLGQHLHAYAPFLLDLTPHLVRDGGNVIAVRARNLGKNSRWYAGSGIHRQVRLQVTPAGARIARWGVAGWTRRIAGGAAEVQVTTRIDGADAGATLVTRLRDAAGRVVAEERSPATAEVAQLLRVRGAHLWSPADPYLHTLESEVVRGGKTVDRLVQNFGIRIVAFDTSRGTTINGERIVLRGGCIHHDNGLLGACAFAQADERRIRLLQARGYNAIRSSHNPASRTLREACDRLGMLLIDEAFDMWHAAKLPDDYSRHFASDWEGPLSAMVLAGRNSPSVIMWSIGNEIPLRSTAEGVEWEWKLANAVRRIDPTRPVTAAINGLLGPLIKASDATARPGKGGKADNASVIFLDVAGYNYRLEDFERDHAAHPDRIMYGSETFASEAWDYRELCARAPYVLGEFVWTAMDYLGEAGIGAPANASVGGAALALAGWPWVVAWCGDLDLLGDPKAPSRYRDVVWGRSRIEVAVERPMPAGKKLRPSTWGWADELPSWSWEGQEGKPLTVRVYTPGDRVVLTLNGARMGEVELKPSDKLKAEFKLPYAAGVLEAVAFAEGREIARQKLETVSAPARLRLHTERPKIGRGRQDLAFVWVEVLDVRGKRVPEAERKINLKIEGPAELAGFGSGNPHAVGSFQASEARSFRGRALVILRATGGKGVVRVTAQADGLEDAAITLRQA